jgi:hypothetical protein
MTHQKRYLGSLLAAVTLSAVFADDAKLPATSPVQQSVPSEQKGPLSSEELRAYVVAVQKFQSLSYLTDEQKKLANYRVKIRKTAQGMIDVFFFAMPRKGDEDAIGGNYEYARSIGVVVEPTTFEVKEVYGSK